MLVAHAIIEEVPDNDNTKSTVDDRHLEYMPAAFAMAAKALPPNATIIANPYEAYLQYITMLEPSIWQTLMLWLPWNLVYFIQPY